MKADPYSSYVTPLPYWTSEAGDLPANIAAALQDAAPHCSQPWLILPGDTISGVTFADYALRWSGEELQILVINGAHANQLSLNPTDCMAMKFFAALLHREVSFITRRGETYHVPYNGVGETKMRSLLKPFMEKMLPVKSAIALPETCLDSPSTTSALERLMVSVFGPEKKPAMAMQTRPVSQVNWGWFRTKTAHYLPAGFGFSDQAFAVANTEKAAFTPVVGESVTLISRDAVEAVSIESNSAANLLKVSVHCAGEREFQAMFADVSAAESARKLVGLSQSSLSARIPMTLVSASEELQRLTGIQLPENAAREALSQIHNFKWLEAERVGFDTWAMIQPENPLRAAAIHWMRKHLGEFQQSLPAAS